MGAKNYRIVIFLGIVLFLSMLFYPFRTNGQVTIEEELKIKEESSPITNQKQSAQDIGIQNHSWQWYQHSFKPQKSGELKIALLNAERYLQSVDSTAYFEIEIWGEDGFRDTTVTAEPILGEPIVGPVYWIDSNDWYLYGEGPFQYEVNPGLSEWGNDATVRLWHEYSSEFLGWECDPFCDRIVEYTYEGKRTDENLGSYPNIVAVSYDWGQQYDFPEGKYLSKYRSFFELDVSGFEFPLEFIDSSILELMARGNNVDPDSKEGYHWQLDEVGESWEENTITWDNQPPVSDRKIVLKNPPRQGFVGYYKLYDLNVQNMVKDWITNPNSNHGLRLSLVDEEVSEEDSWDRFISIPGSDGDWSLGKPKLTINFSNLKYQPTTYSISAGQVGKGDTVLVAFKNKENYWNSIGNFIHEDTVDGEKFEGRQFNYENWKGSGDPIGRRRPGYLNAFVYVGEKEREEILLGETKYYAAQWKDLAKKEKILIEEVETDGSGEPVAPSALISGAFSDEPIEVMSGGKSGVYWERKWASVNDNGSISSGNLPSGMIRVVGRYWEEEKDYKVKLKADAAVGNGELEIEVVKPDQLGNKYDKARNVFDKVVDIDSVIIANAGKYGVPPQMIKGHINKESFAKNFGGSVGWGFTPGYLYEPYSVEFDIRSAKRDYAIKNEAPYHWLESPYKVTESSMGTGESVPIHLYLEKLTYPKSPQTIWDMVRRYSHFKGKPSEGGWPQYGQLENSGKLKFIYSRPKKIYEEILASFKEVYSGDTLFTVARDSMSKYLKDKWRGGLENMYAQTRIASSYGPLQVLYTTSRDYNYSVKRKNGKLAARPEDLSELAVHFKVVMLLYQTHLQNQITKEVNWEKGYEQSWYQVVHEWNPYAPQYEEKVYKFMNLYLPQTN